ncbi:MAG: DUF2975 domain-containing protein [Pseudomonadota bacterium]
MFGKNLPKDWLLRTGLLGSLIVRAILWFGIAALVLGLGYIALGDPAGFADLDAELAREGVAMSGKPALLIIFTFVLVIIILFERLIQQVMQIIHSVDEGDPFVPANAERLDRIGWLLLATQLLAFIGTSINAVEALASEWNFGEQFSFEGLLSVVLVFILARIFRHGTQMRDDLEGTV